MGTLSELELASVLTAALAAGSVGAVLAVVMHSRSRPSDAPPASGRARFPARLLERAILLGVVVVVIAVVPALAVGDVIAAVAVVVAVAFAAWRGSFMSLRDSLGDDRIGDDRVGGRRG